MDWLPTSELVSVALLEDLNTPRPQSWRRQWDKRRTNARPGHTVLVRACPARLLRSALLCLFSVCIWVLLSSGHSSGKLNLLWHILCYWRTEGSCKSQGPSLNLPQPEDSSGRPLKAHAGIRTLQHSLLVSDVLWAPEGSHLLFHFLSRAHLVRQSWPKRARLSSH